MKSITKDMSRHSDKGIRHCFYKIVADINLETPAFPKDVLSWQEGSQDLELSPLIIGMLLLKPDCFTVGSSRHCLRLFPCTCFAWH